MHLHWEYMNTFHAVDVALHIEIRNQEFSVTNM